MNPDELNTIKDSFWDVRYREQDVAAYQRYLEILRLRSEGHSAASIGRMLRMNNVGKYLKGQKKPFLASLGKYAENLGRPREGFRWLPMRLKARGAPEDEWVQVPTQIRSFQDILAVLQQRSPVEEVSMLMPQFGYGSRSELTEEREEIFGFLLGAVLGDASKPEKGQSRFPSMTIALTLSKRKPNSLRFGQFVSLSIQACLGLKMNRIRDAARSVWRFTDAECYRWVSQASPILFWLFRVCLGLKEGETTTRNPVKMDWILRTPRGFKIHFLQGLVESDGYVDCGRDRVVLASSPNT